MMIRLDFKSQVQSLSNKNNEDNENSKTNKTSKTINEQNDKTPQCPTCHEVLRPRITNNGKVILECEGCLRQFQPDFFVSNKPSTFLRPFDFGLV
jgi:NAD-dependent SIR2 family protein deacetylase